MGVREPGKGGTTGAETEFFPLCYAPRTVKSAIYIFHTQCRSDCSPAYYAYSHNFTAIILAFSGLSSSLLPVLFEHRM